MSRMRPNPLPGVPLGIIASSLVIVVSNKGFGLPAGQGHRIGALDLQPQTIQYLLLGGNSCVITFNPYTVMHPDQALIDTIGHTVMLGWYSLAVLICAAIAHNAGKGKEQNSATD